MTYACIFFAASVLANRRGIQLVLALVLGSTSFVAVTTIAHGMVDAKKVFGIYEPAHPFPSSQFGPLLNPNNLAGYLNLGSIVGLGLMLARKPLVPMWLAGLGVSVNIAAAVRSGSRGGVAALLLGVVLLALLVQRWGSGHSQTRRRIFPLALAGGAVVFGGALALLGGDAFIWRDLLSDNVAKLKIVSWTGPMIRDFGAFGVGRGAFESVFAAYKPTGGQHVVYTHPENFLAQWSSEWGVPVALAAILGLSWLFRPGALGVRRSVVVAAGWSALCALLLQNLADLGLEIPGIALGAVVVMGALWGDPARRRAKGRSVLDRWIAGIGAQRFALAMLVLAVGLGALALARGRHDVSAERDILRERFELADETPSERAAFRAELLAAMRRRPAEQYFSLLGATAAFRWKDQSAFPWLTLALERAPVNGRAHALLASVLAARGAKKQALLELRLAVTYEPGLAEKTSPLAVSIAKNYDELITAVPEGQAGSIVLAIMARDLMKPEQTELRHQVDVEAVARDPALVESRLRLLSTLFEDIGRLKEGKPASLGCATEEACAAEIERHASAIDTAKPNSTLGAVMRARGLVARGRRTEAEILLSQGCARLESRSDCLQIRAENLSAMGELTKLDATLKEYMSSTCTSAPTCAEAASFVGRLRASRGDQHAAASAFLRAAQEDPTESRLLAAAEAAERAKMYVQAIEALSRLLSMRGGNDTEVSARIAKLRSTLAADQVMRY
ncbi:MAG: lipid A core--O-antigen ligase [Polyangiaceae bacterium]|nr:lipid A core--O-antigen ligase [Polyangiaceae bacterium]